LRSRSLANTARLRKKGDYCSRFINENKSSIF
jgi:hypothetical protein